MNLDTPEKLSTSTIVLHWVVGVVIIGLLGTGWYMAEYRVFPLYPWHKSFGVLIALFVLLRVIWRIKNGWPTPVSTYTHFEVMLSKSVHYVLIIGSVLMPLSGALASAMEGRDIPFFGLELVAKVVDPANPREVIPRNEALAAFGDSIHYWVGYTMIAAVILHIIGALKHHLVDKDGTLRRMLGAQVGTDN